MAEQQQARQVPLDERSGAPNWPGVLALAGRVAAAGYLSADEAAMLKERLKSEAPHVVLNTLTALHTITLNAPAAVRNQLSLSKVMKHLERLTSKPPFPGVEAAAAQLLIDSAFLHGPPEELGRRAYQVLLARQARSAVAGMGPSDVAVMTREDARIGLPRFERVARGLDFGRAFGGLASGSAEPPSVLSALARAAVAASYSGDSAGEAAAAAASSNTFAAWAERVQQDPPAAAQRVLDNVQQVHSDMAALETAQEAVLTAARAFAGSSVCGGRNGAGAAAAGSSSGISGISKAAASSGEYKVLRSELDKAFLIACKVAEHREMIQVLVQQSLPRAQLSALLALADQLNATLEEWQAASTTEVFWLLGVDIAGLADGSLLHLVAPGAAAAAAAAAAQPAGGKQQKQSGGGLSSANSGSYLDLLTGDLLTPSMGSSNPFTGQQQAAAPAPAAAAMVQGSSASPASPVQQQQPQQLQALSPGGGSSSSSSLATAVPVQQQQQARAQSMPAQLQQQPQRQPQQWPSQQLAYVQQVQQGLHSTVQQQQWLHQQPQAPVQTAVGSGCSGSSTVTSTGGSRLAAPGAAAGAGSRQHSNPAAAGRAALSCLNPFADLGTAASTGSGSSTSRPANAAGHTGGRSSKDPPGQQQLGQHKREPPPLPVAAAAAAAAQQGTQHAQPPPLASQASSTSSGSFNGQAGNGAAAAAAEAQTTQQESSQQPHGDSSIVQLQQKLQDVLAGCGRGRLCHTCRLPPAASLHAALMQLLVAQQQEWEARLQAQAAAHQQEVADIKAAAVSKFKELMQQQQPTQQVQQASVHAQQQQAARPPAGPSAG